MKKVYTPKEEIMTTVLHHDVTFGPHEVAVAFRTFTDLLGFMDLDAAVLTEEDLFGFYLLGNMIADKLENMIEKTGKDTARN